jgi:hypothetical protein
MISKYNCGNNNLYLNFRQRVDAPARYQMAGRPVLNREQLNDNNAL